MMKTAHTGWTQTARRHTLYLFAIFTLLGTFLLPSCRDEELVPTPYAQGANAGVSHADDTTTSGLVQNEDGTWTATRRVPLVGAGRMMSNVSPSLIELGGWGAEAENLTDTDLTNAYTAGNSIVGGNLVANQIVSVIDVGHVYAAGQKAGFVFSDNSDNGVLNLSVLKIFSVETFLDGVRQDEMDFSNASSLVDLGVGNIAGGTAQKKSVIEVTTTKPFDEIRLSVGGIDLSVLNSMEIYYAYVGENPIIPAVNHCTQSPISTTYFGDNVGYPDPLRELGWSSGYLDYSLNKLVDGDLSNGIGIETVSSLFQPTMTVDFGREVPAGSEVGFYITNGDLLKLSIGGTTRLATFSGEDRDIDHDDFLDEYTHTEIVGLNVAGGGASYISMITTKPCQRLMIQFLGVTVKLGVTSVHYAFVREPDRVDISSYFNMADATTYLPTYRFALPQGISGVKIDAVTEHPNRAEPKIKQMEDGSYVIYNMNIAGEYVVRATYTDANGETVTCEATITRAVKSGDNCRKPLINEEGEDRFDVGVANGFKGIVLGGGIKEGDYSMVVDSETRNFIRMTNVSIDLIQNQNLVTVSTKNGEVINPGTNEKRRARAGFVINRNADFLDLSVLKFLMIDLYRNGQQVDSQAGDANNGVSLGLIQTGDSNTKQACLSIETEEEFDKIVLKCGGLAGVQLGGSLDVYYAYYEEAGENCANPGEECMQLITNANYGAVPSSSVTGLLHVGSGMAGLANVVDDDIETYCEMVNVLSAGGADTLSVKFDEISSNPGKVSGGENQGYQEVGFIVSGLTGLANAEILKYVTIIAYCDGEVVAKTEPSGGVLSLKVAGKGEKRYYSVIPPENFDELAISFQGLVGVDYVRVHGLYLLPDYDGDGAPDCVNDELSTVITGVYAEPQDICLGDAISFRVDGGEEGVDYTLTFKDEKGNKLTDIEENPVTVIINSAGRFEFKTEDQDFISKLPAGKYYVDVARDGVVEWYNTEVEVGQGIKAEGPLMTIHPDETTWTGSVSSDWTDWDNWTQGVPWNCTNVIIPSPSGSSMIGNDAQVNYYPVLAAETNAQCNFIHFEPGGELVGQEHLQYESAWVDMNLDGGSYNLLSAPMQGMVTGDMFLLEAAAAYPGYFSVLDENSYKENRQNPLVYQRFWSDVVSNKTVSRAGYSTEDDAIAADADGELLFTDWTRSFNRVSEIYERGQGFALRVGNEGDTGKGYPFHFPKTHTTYHYYTLGQNEAVGSDGVTRFGTGKLMVDRDFPETLGLYRETEGTVFLFGNPFMAHISIQDLLDANANISAVYVYRGNGDGTGAYVAVGKDGVSNVANAPAKIAPMEAVFVKVTDEQKSAYFGLKLDPDMLGQKGQADTYNTFVPQLRMTASRNGSSASCVVLHSGEASDGYDSREDAALLVGKEEGTDVAVYTTAGRKALSIQRVNGAARIPVGFYMKRTGDVDLKFEAGDDWSGWQLTDTQTGRSYPLEGTVSLDNVADGTGRFYLEKR